MLYLYIDKCETIVKYVGDNDADYGEDYEKHHDKYEEVLDIATDGSGRVIM